MFSFFHNNMLYTMVEMQRQSLEPLRHLIKANKSLGKPLLTHNKIGRSILASYEMFDRVTRDYYKPEFGIKETLIDGKAVKIKEKTVLKKTFCNLLHFEKEGSHNLPKMLVVAPMSGHHSTLLRGTVEGLLPKFDVYITDWVNARDVAVDDGLFTFDDFVSYVIEFIQLTGKNTNVMAVCQPSVPVSAAVSLMSAEDSPYVPDSMILMGGPIDTRKNPTEVNDYAAMRNIVWFESNVITKVPVNYKGAGRSVYPGFTQLYGFMAMNLKTHMKAHWDLFNDLVKGDGENVASHKKFYNEYLSVMDLPAEFYLQTVNEVFKKHSLPLGKMVVHGKNVDMGKIKHTNLLCIEGEKDDISGRGQTKAAINLCSGLPDSKKKYHLQKGVGHYGIFNGKRYRDEIVPVIVDFVKKAAPKDAKPAKTEPPVKKESEVKKASPSSKAATTKNTEKAVNVVPIKKTDKVKSKAKKSSAKGKKAK